jgi:hypothetical protein
VTALALPADLLYGRLLATAAQHLLAGGPPARLRSADGRHLAALRASGRRALGVDLSAVAGGRWHARLRRP